MIVKPAQPGLTIRDPRTQRPLPDEGAQVPDNQFWQRRLDHGDVVRVAEPSPAASADAPAKRSAPSKAPPAATAASTTDKG